MFESALETSQVRSNLVLGTLKASIKRTLGETTIENSQLE